MAGRKPYDPRVKMPNFGMQYAAPETENPDIQSKAAEPLNDSGPSDTGFSNLTPAPESQLRPPQYGDRQHHGDPVEIKNPREGKPFGFALAHGTDGASIWWGVLAATVSVITVKREDGKITEITQDQIITTNIYPASNLDTDTRLQTHLGWYGDVYLYWEANEDGEISNVEVKGPDVPDGVNIGDLDANLEREITDGKYFVKIGTVDEDSPVDQQISGDVPWFVTIVKGDNSSSSSSSGSSSSGSSSSGSSSSGSSSSGSSSSGSSSSEKSNNAIVRMPWHEDGFGALATVESNEVLFRFPMRDIPLTGRTTAVRIDPRFIYLCEKGTLRVLAAPNGDKPYPVSASISGGRLILKTLPFLRPNKVDLELVGVRAGYIGWDAPSRTAKQFAQNETFLQSAYDR